MCYSALVLQHAKKLGFTYKARIQTDLFEDLFERRSRGGGEIIPPAMELSFLEDPASAAEKRIAKLIREYRKERIAYYEKEMFVQAKRIADNERKLKAKVTKGAQEHVRVATAKIETFKSKIGQLQGTEVGDGYGRIFPLQYAPLVVSLDGELVVAPFRFLLRPKGQTAMWDKQFYGSYNARRDNLQGKSWKPIFGRNHGIIELKSFYERVSLHDYERRKLKSGEEERRIELRFNPKGSQTLISPCIFELNKADDLIGSFALITDDPNPEVAEAGHDRTPIFMRPDNVGAWLSPSRHNQAEFLELLKDKQSTAFSAVVQAA